MTFLILIGTKATEDTSLFTVSERLKSNRQFSIPKLYSWRFNPKFEEERTKVVGMTASGRILEVVFTFRGEAIRAVTAYDAPSRLRTRYLERRSG